MRCGAVRCGAVRCGCGAVRCGAVRCGAVRCGAVRCVRCGAVRCGAVDAMTSNIHFRAPTARTSDETAIACIQDGVLRSLDARKHVVLVLLDLSAAFDTIDDDILLTGLCRIGVRGDTLYWFVSYLTDRTQCFSIDGLIYCRTIAHCRTALPNKVSGT